MKIDIDKIKKERTIKELLEFSIINMDKPSGPTSFKVDEKVKLMLGLRKTSHFGTLDPKVTGVLPIALNRACKLTGYFIGHDKVYVGIMKIHKEIEEEKLREEMKKFEGKIKQVPPVKSRVKRQEREREVKKFELIEYDKEKREVLFISDVQAGTYIRKLIHDLGLKIGGAHMLELRRTQASIFKEADSVDMYKFIEAVEEYKKGGKRNEDKLREILIPGEIIGNILPIVVVKKPWIKRLYAGSPIFKKYLKNKDYEKLKGAEKIIVFSDNKFIEVAKVTNKEEIFAKPEFVFN